MSTKFSAATSAFFSNSSEKLARASQDAKAKATSIKAWELPKLPSSLAPEHVWSNPDQDPVPLEKQTWNSFSYVGYWFSDLFTTTTWETASSALVLGLGTTDAILIALVAGICNAIPMVFNGAIGADLHIPFPVAVRSSFGYWFSYFAVVSRCILALFWFGLQGYGGASAVASLITAIWPSFANLPNHLPEDSGTTTQMMVAYFLYNLIQLPFLLIPTHKLQYMFMLKAVLVPPMVLGMVIWTCLKASGTSGVFTVEPTVYGSTRVWLWLKTMTSITGGYSTLACNIPDFSRFSKRRGSQWWQLPIVPFFKVITSLFGIICTGASKHIYGSYQWNPLYIVSSWGTTPGGRFMAFLCSAIWLLAQLSCNVSANAVSFANDMTTLMPRWFNIRRGVIFASIFGAYALVPWKIEESASNLLSFMSGYAIFMAPFAGLLCCDYWVVKKRKIDVPALYDPNGIYRYNKYGTNWRALVIILIVVTPLLPGLAYAVSPTTVHISTGLKHLYYINWLFGFSTSFASYYVLSTLFPARETLVPATILGTASTLEGIEDQEATAVETESIKFSEKNTGSGQNSSVEK